MAHLSAFVMCQRSAGPGGQRTTHVRCASRHESAPVDSPGRRSGLAGDVRALVKGHESFCKAAPQTLARVGQLLSFPDGIRRRELRVEVPIAYKLDDR